MMAWWDAVVGRRKRPAGPMPTRLIERDPARGDAPATGLPRFRSFAADQLRSVRGGPLQEARLKLRDAFTPSQPVTDERMFAGRVPVIAALIRAIEEQRLHVVVYGDRGIGKTSLLHVLAGLAGEARYLVHYESCGEETDFDTLIRSVAARIPQLYHQSYAAGETEGERTLADLLPAGPVTPRVAGELFARLTATRLLLVIDEFDRSAPGLFRRQVAELVKTLSDRSIPVQLVIAGVAANLTELVEAIPSIRRNILGMQVPLMAPEEMAALIEHGQRLSGLFYQPAAVERIAAIAAGSPYLASLIGQHAGLAAIDRDTLSVEPADVAAAVERAAEEIAGRVSERSRYEVAAAHRAGLGAVLDRMAGAALADSGRFAPDPNGTADGDSLARLVDEFALVEPLPGDPGARYRFREESVPVFLWMERARAV